MQVSFIGSGDALGNGGRFQACILLHAPGHDSVDVQRTIRFHLDLATLQQQASRLGARRVILTHMSPDLLARVDEVGWETASDGMTLQLATAAP